MVRIFKNKKGSDMLPEQVIFIVLNIVFFVVLLTFISKSSDGASLYEQSYAKQIALMLDRAKPGTTFVMDIMDGINVKDKSKSLNETIKIDKENNKVIVSLRGSTGYTFKYFHNYDLEYKITNKYLTVSVKGEETK